MPRIRYEPTTIVKSVKHEQSNLIHAPFGQWSVSINPQLQYPSLHTSIQESAWLGSVCRSTRRRCAQGFGLFHSVLYSRDTNHWLQPPFLTVAQSTTSKSADSISVPVHECPRSAGTVIPIDGTLSCTNCD
jgi:hypothetical protein